MFGSMRKTQGQTAGRSTSRIASRTLNRRPERIHGAVASRARIAGK